MANQVTHYHAGASENADNNGVLPLKILCDLRPNLCQALVNVLTAEEDLLDVIMQLCWGEWQSM